MMKADTKILITMPIWILPALLGLLVGIVWCPFVESIRDMFKIYDKWFKESEDK